MPDYECHTIPLEKMMVSAQGIDEPMCNSCLSPDCTNPIKKKTVSIMGKPTDWRVWNVRNVCRVVLNCKGYVTGIEDDDDEIST